MANNNSSKKNSDDDRISNLPEPILHHILSFLSTKQAARTSVLSKLWQYQWTWLPNLDISESEICQRDMSFDQILLKIFLSRRAWCIRKLRLASSSCYTSNFVQISISSILCAAVERSVEELDFNTHKLFELPTRLLCCKTLVVLKLCGKIMIDIGSSSVHLPSLKVLRLEMVKYKDEDTFRSLFPACPVLDYLDLGFDTSTSHHDFHYEISSLSVRRVTLHNNRFMYCSGIYVPSKITVTAPALEHFTIEVAPRVLVLNNVSSSVPAKFNIFLHGMIWREIYWETIMVIFGALCKVQFLELNFVSSMDYEHDNIPIFPRFDNLAEMKLVSGFCSLPILLNMLLSCSRLERLTLVSKVRDLCRERHCWICPQHVPDCLAFHLTAVEFEGFQGSEGEMEFIKYVLNNSRVLRSITIRYVNKTNLDRFGAFQKIFGFEKKATQCQLSFQQQQ